MQEINPIGFAEAAAWAAQVGYSSVLKSLKGIVHQSTSIDKT
jgi:hypothetical protein